MADIAREMGVSQGLLYNYVESKEALFYLVVDRGLTQENDAESLSFPVRTPAPGAIVKRLTERFRRDLGMPLLSAAIKRAQAHDPSAELEAVVRELYASVDRNRHATTMLERSALDMPELAALFYGKMRPHLISRLTRFIELRIEAGQFRPVPYPAVAARLILETVTWFARNRRGDPASQDISDQAAEEATVDFLVNSLVPPSRRMKTARTEKQTASTHR